MWVLNTDMIKMWSHTLAECARYKAFFDNFLSVGDFFLWPF